VARDAISTLTGSSTGGTQTHVTGTSSGVKRGLDVSVITGTGPLAGVNWDALDVQQTSATVETYLFKSGGISGTVLKTCVITYVAADKADLDTVVWS